MNSFVNSTRLVKNVMLFPTSVSLAVGVRSDSCVPLRQKVEGS